MALQDEWHLDSYLDPGGLLSITLLYSQAVGPAEQGHFVVSTESYQEW